jgi:hypothetical protein
LIFAIDRTQWRSQNLFVISLIEQKRAIPVYWILLPKRGCSNLDEQKKLIRPLLRLFKGYRILVLGDREFHSIKLANWLHSKKLALCCVKNKALIFGKKISHINVYNL